MMEIARIFFARPSRRIITDLTPRFTSASDSVVDICVLVMLAPGVMAVIAMVVG